MIAQDIPAAYVQRIAQYESGGNALARARGSSALGLFQFTAGTWRSLRAQHPELNLTLDGRTDTRQSERALRAFTADNAAFLRFRLGRQARLSELYLAHFLGQGGALAVITCPPAASIVHAVGAVVVRANAFLRGMSCADVIRWAELRMPADPTYLPAGRGPNGPGRTPQPTPSSRTVTADMLNMRELRKGELP